MGNTFDLSLHGYAESGDFDGVRAYVARGGNINKRDLYQNTALHRASCMGYKRIVRYLIQHGADVNARAKDGWTPLHLAARWGRISIIHILIEAGADCHMITNDGRYASELLKSGTPTVDANKIYDLLSSRPETAPRDPDTYFMCLLCT